MGKIGQGVLKDWSDGTYVHGDDFDQAFEIVRVAVNDTDDKATDAKTKVDGFSTRVDSLEFVGNQRDVRVRETFVAAAGQTLFTLVKGTYQTGKQLLDVSDGTKFMYAGQGLTETSPSSFTLTVGANVGTVITATYYIANAPLGTAHGVTHKAGGLDELKVSDLAGYSTMLDSINTPLQTNINALNKEMDTVRRKDIANLSLSLAASQRVSAPDYLGSTGASNQMGISFKNISKRSTNSLTIGTTNIILDDITSIVVGDELTIYDDVSLERVTVTVINVPAKQITIEVALTKAYKTNASVVKSMYIEHFIDGFYTRGWMQPSGATASSGSVVLDNSQTGNAAAPYYFGANNNTIAMTEDGTIFCVYQSKHSEAQNSYYKLNKLTNSGLSNSGTYMTVESGFSETNVPNKIQAVFNLGGVYIAWVFTRGYTTGTEEVAKMYIRVINTHTGDYKETELSIENIGNFNHDFALSADKKKLYFAYAGSLSSTSLQSVKLYTINILPDMSVTLETEYNVGNGNVAIISNITELKLVVAKGYICVYFRYDAGNTTNNLNGLYVTYRGLVNINWSNPMFIWNNTVSTTYYQPMALDVLVDSNDVIWIALTSSNATDIKTYLTYNTSTNPYAFTTPFTIDTVAGYNAQLSETATDILVFATAANTDPTDLCYIGYSKATKLLSISRTALGISADGAILPIGTKTFGYRVLHGSGNLLTSGYFIMYTDNSGQLLYKAANYGTKYYPLKDTDVRFNVSNVKELTLYIEKNNSLASVDGYIGTVQATKTETATEVMLDWVLPSMLATAEVRLNFTRTIATNNYKFTRIVGGKSDV